MGSFLPDLAVTKIITWYPEGGLHGMEGAKNFKQFIEQKYPDYLELAHGVIAHNILDDFTHLEYKVKPGYAFQNNKELIERIVDAYKIDPESAKGLAHNYIESAVDMLLLKTHPELGIDLKNAVKLLNREQLAEILANFFQKEQQEVLEKLNFFLDLFTKYNFSKREEWATFWSDLEQLMNLPDIDQNKRKELLTFSQKITKNTYEEFIDYSIKYGKEKF